MKKYDYHRSSALRTGPSRRPRKKSSVLILKIFFLLCFLAGLCGGGYWAATKGYRALSEARLGTWKPSSVVVSGVGGAIAGEIQNIAQPKTQASFSSQDAAKLQTELARKYSQFKRVQVERGLFSGKLKISIKRRAALARFEQAGKIHFMDEDGAVYEDPQPDPLQPVQQIELIGQPPQNLSKEFAGFVGSVLKLKKELHFSTLQFDLKKDTVTLFLPDGSVLALGAAKQLRQKAHRAAQIQAHAAKSGLGPYEADFTYFENGKVFLRQKSI